MGARLGASFVLAAAAPIQYASDDIYLSTGVRHARNLTGLYRSPPGAQASVELCVQGIRYLSKPHRVPTEYPSSISAVLRTRDVWVDRAQVRVTYQVKDRFGDVGVTQPTAVVLRIAHLSQTVEVSCDTSGTQDPGKWYLGYCTAASLRNSWFVSSPSARADVSVILRGGMSSGDVVSTDFPSLTVHAQPSWWDAGLRAATVGNGLSAPAGLSSRGGVFITLPASPVYAGEDFYAYMYAHTAGLALTTWRVRLYFEGALLEFVAFEQSDDFNTASVSALSGEVSWLANGIKAATADTQVTGSAIYLLRARMRLASGASDGIYASSTLSLYPRATELVSGAAFVQEVNGLVFDGRDGAQSLGRLVVISSSPAGIFAFPPGGTLANMEPLTGTVSSYSLTVVQVGSDDRYDEEAAVLSGSVCGSAEPAALLTLSGCSIVLGAGQSMSSSGANVQVYHGIFNTRVSVDIFTPTQLSLVMDDNVLNRFGGANGEVISSCTSAVRAAYPYQRAGIKAYVSSLDVTALVSFTTLDSLVASVSSSRYDIIEGRQAGETTAHLSGRLGALPSVTITVSDSIVIASELVGQVITGSAWSAGDQFLPGYTVGSTMLVMAEVSNAMTAEGHIGRMFTRVVWSDGHEEDVGYSPEAAVEELTVISGTSGVSLVAPSASERFWQVGVAVGAVKECVTAVSVVWTVCETQVSSAGSEPGYLQRDPRLGSESDPGSHGYLHQHPNPCASNHANLTRSHNTLPNLFDSSSHGFG